MVSGPERDSNVPLSDFFFFCVRKDKVHEEVIKKTVVLKLGIRGIFIVSSSALQVAKD